MRINISNFSKTDAEVRALAIRLLAGDQTAIQPTIECHIELAYKIAGKYRKKSNDKSSDKLDSLNAQALFELTRLVNRIVTDGTLYDTNVTPYIARSLHSYLQRFLVFDRLIPIEPDAFREMAKSGKLFEFLPITMLMKDDIDQSEQDEMESFHEDSFKNRPSTYMPVRSNTDLDKLDIINSLVWGDVDQKIIDKLKEGYTYESIGLETGHTKQYVMYRLKTIQRRVYEILEGNG